MRLTKLKPYILLLPVTVYILFIIIAGVVSGFFGSLGYIPGLSKTEITLKYYREVFESPGFINSLIFTLKYTLLSTFLSVTSGVLTAVLLNSLKHKRFISWLLKIPVVIPHLTAALYIILIFSDYGILG